MQQSEFDSYAQWLLSRYPTPAVEHRNVGTLGAMLLRIETAEIFPDPATPDLTIQLLCAGQGHVSADLGFGRWQAPAYPPGLISVTPAFAPLNFWGWGQAEFLAVAIPWRKLQPLLEEAAERDVPDLGRLHAQASRDPATKRLMHLLWQETAQGRPGGTLFADGLLLALSARLLGLAEHPVGAQPDTRRLGRTDLERVLSFIQDNLTEDLSLDALAGCVHLSPFHFSRLFKQSTGQSPHQFVIAQRVERAKALLRTRTLTAGGVALAVGFADQAHLSHHFKRLVGVTPGQYAKDCRC